MRALVTAKRDDGKKFYTVSRRTTRNIIGNEKRHGACVTPLMIEGWLAGQAFDGMSLRPDFPYHTIAEMQERYPEIVVELQ